MTYLRERQGLMPRQQPQHRNATASVGMSAAAGAATADDIYWAECDRCGKWRVVAQPLPEGDPFVCKNAPGKTCVMPEDTDVRW
jgi:hypothetical protein